MNCKDMQVLTEVTLASPAAAREWTMMENQMERMKSLLVIPFVIGAIILFVIHYAFDLENISSVYKYLVAYALSSFCVSLSFLFSGKIFGWIYYVLRDDSPAAAQREK